MYILHNSLLLTIAVVCVQMNNFVTERSSVWASCQNSIFQNSIDNSFFSCPSHSSMRNVLLYGISFNCRSLRVFKFETIFVFSRSLNVVAPPPPQAYIVTRIIQKIALEYRSDSASSIDYPFSEIWRTLFKRSFSAVVWTRG